MPAHRRRLTDGVGPERRLAVYGTLRPGEPNHHELADLRGRWSEGHVRGRLVEATWRGQVLRGLVLDDPTGRVGVWLLESDDLVAHWERLDEFEGRGFARTDVAVHTRAGEVRAYAYLVDPAGTAPAAP